MGSGTTGIAALAGDRHFIGCETDERYFDTALRRIGDADAQGRLAL